MDILQTTARTSRGLRMERLHCQAFIRSTKSQHDLLGILYFAAGGSLPRNNPNEKIDVTTRAMLTRIVNKQDEFEKFRFAQYDDDDGVDSVLE